MYVEAYAERLCICVTFSDDVLTIFTEREKNARRMCHVIKRVEHNIKEKRRQITHEPYMSIFIQTYYYQQTLVGSQSNE